MDDQNRAEQPFPGSEPQQPFAPSADVQQPAQPQPQQPAAPQSQPGYSYGQPVSQPYYQQPAPQSSGKATGALVCGILAILFSALPLFGIVLGIVAIVLAAKAVKESGKDGKTTGGKVCGIIGIVLSVLAFILYLVLTFGIAAYVVASSDDISYSGSSSSLPSLPSASDESEKAMQDALAEQLDKVKAKDPTIVQKLASEADGRLVDVTGSSLTDLGIDPVLFVEWMMGDFDYETGSAYDLGDGTGSAYATLTLRDSAAFAATFAEDVQAVIDSGEMETLDEATAKVRLGEIYQGAMDKTTTTVTDAISVDMVNVGDAWQVDEDSWEYEVEYLFGL